MDEKYQAGEQKRKANIVNPKKIRSHTPTFLIVFLHSVGWSRIPVLLHSLLPQRCAAAQQPPLFAMILEEQFKSRITLIVPALPAEALLINVAY